MLNDQRHNANSGVSVSAIQKNESVRTPSEITKLPASRGGRTAWNPKYANAAVGRNARRPKSRPPQNFPSKITQSGVGVAKICSSVPFQRSSWMPFPPSRYATDQYPISPPPRTPYTTCDEAAPGVLRTYKPTAANSTGKTSQFR